ncbi:potassium channel family protein [Mesorhizobium sp.]|uniref:potassium channel family protein n=1 Tax=Mesorhizobium sp. TaxID=1871066 RepID=UPI00338E0AA1
MICCSWSSQQSLLTWWGSVFSRSPTPGCTTIQNLGGLAGLFSGSAADFFYFSVTCYTTIGFGAVYATGPMRIVAALEGLNGLVLIAWSASFAYASTSDLWKRKQD